MEARKLEPYDATRDELVALLRVHSHELEEAMVARIRNAEPSLDFAADDFAWLRPAVTEAVKGVATLLEEGERWAGGLPPGVATEIQAVTRRGASLETVLRGFSLAGNVLFEFFTERIVELPQAQAALGYAAGWQNWNSDRIRNAISAEHKKEVERLSSEPSRHLARNVERLLAGGTIEHADLGYRLKACHVGAIATGAQAELRCRSLAERLGCDLLTVPRADETVWVWFGSPRQIEFTRLEQLAAKNGSLSLAAGEPRNGLEGWRLTHREAEAALAVARLEPPRLVRYSDVALVADALRNEVTAKALVERYLGPLDKRRDAEQLRTTVRSYLDSDCNAASAASALGVNRHTVQRRLRRVEEAIGESTRARRSELDVALRLERLTLQPSEGGRVSRRAS